MNKQTSITIEYNGVEQTLNEWISVYSNIQNMPVNLAFKVIGLFGCNIKVRNNVVLVGSCDE